MLFNELFVNYIFSYITYNKLLMHNLSKLKRGEVRDFCVLNIFLCVRLLVDHRKIWFSSNFCLTIYVYILMMNYVHTGRERWESRNWWKRSIGLWRKTWICMSVNITNVNIMSLWWESSTSVKSKLLHFSISFNLQFLFYITVWEITCT